MSANDTIAAIATPPGQGGVGIVRVSGPKVWEIADGIFKSSERPSLAKGGTFLHGKVLADDGTEIDEALCLIFRAPKSYTGEDTIEIQGHGGPVVLKKILRRCLDAGARMAEPGEFTKRAFLNGKMDLVQAEAVADLRWRLGLEDEDETRCDQCDRPIDGDCFRSRIGEPICSSCWDESTERAAGVAERRSFQASWAGAR